MSAIGYITDSKLLELHRLNNHTTMNFWRLSTNLNFSDFGLGDLVFFLSKDKEHTKDKEKGIVGVGRVKKIHLDTVKYLWDTYGIYNGYKTLDDFKQAIIKVSKDKKLPKKISSFYLEDVMFFHPIYLSECGLNISNNIESYIYIPDDISLKILDLSNSNTDIWTINTSINIEKMKMITSLVNAHNKAGNIIKNEVVNKKAYKELSKLEGYKFIGESKTEVYKIENDNLEIIFYYDKKIDYRVLLGQRDLYINYLGNYMSLYNVYFKYLDVDKEIKLLTNSI